MTTDEELGERAFRIDSTIERVRGRAQTSDGSVVVESDPYGNIAKLEISPFAMSVDASRLANAIAQCHRIAKERAETEAVKVFTELRAAEDRAAQLPAPAPTPEWEESTPLRITYGV
ncbi:hypothetical protein LTV02_39040 [Nocardia yamanashiensis]|uniref:hypothetical protein n=1 Tax=Nocardia yamanashiensis TaxID=209247 RepID=UPI001E5F63BF|nr:hypothetical protein [Nocardia yamanashiensis]UGT41831.1 hypothetical protein LTV02_39040 [Nocardia yamanashiensis]